MSGLSRSSLASSKPLYPVHFRRVLRPRASAVRERVAIRDPLIVSSSGRAESRVFAEKAVILAQLERLHARCALQSATRNRGFAGDSAGLWRFEAALDVHGIAVAMRRWAKND